MNRKKRSNKGSASSQFRRTYFGIGVAALIAAVAAAFLEFWPRFFPVNPERTVDVYWTHECDCGRQWVNVLKASGFEVREFEPETLQPIRASLRTPEELHGCHIASYLGYFVEGHVPPRDLQRLAVERPSALGVAARRAQESRNQDDIVIYNGGEQPHLWASGIDPVENN